MTMQTTQTVIRASQVTNAMRNLVAYLRDDCGAVDVSPIRVTIKGTIYDGATYRQPSHGDEGERLYLLGDLPACYRRSSRTAFRFRDDSADWFIACYAQPADFLRMSAEQVAMHPCGKFFMLCRWEVPSGDLIDTHAVRPYNRVFCDRRAM